MKVTVKKWGNSQGIRLPKYVLKAIDVTDVNTELTLTINNNKYIVLEKAKEPLTIDKLFEGFDYEKYWADWDKEHSNQSKEVDFGKSIGKEVNM